MFSEKRLSFFYLIGFALLVFVPFSSLAQNKKDFHNFGSLNSEPEKKRATLSLPNGEEILILSPRKLENKEGDVVSVRGVRLQHEIIGDIVVTTTETEDSAESVEVLAAPGGSKGGKGKPAASQCNDHIDNDGDGYCDASGKRAYCNDGSIPGDSDCTDKNDASESCEPQSERCDGLDNDCDGLIDEENVCSSADYYCDTDSDGYFSDIVSGSCEEYQCVPSACRLNSGTDCNDNNTGINIGVSENCDSDGLDNDCDGQIDECSPCFNSVKDGDETDVDCGGSCTACANEASCQINEDCLSNNCQNGQCQNSSPGLNEHCHALKYDNTGFEGHLNLVFVPSGFNDMSFFKDRAEWIYGIFSNYQPFSSDIAQLNAFYVSQDAGDYCDLNCNGISRLLCCSTSTARTLSATCTSGPRHTVVVHNSTSYGGAGYTSADVATTTIHSSAPKVAVHELGHSAFQLADEYNYATSFSTSGRPNCDTSGCSKWADLIGYKGVTCQPNHCYGGQYYASENTLMKSLSYSFEEVNLRISCCMYLQETGSLPAYCSQFQQRAPGGDLSKMCENTSFTAIGAAPSEFVAAPVEYSFRRDGETWILDDKRSLRAGRYSIEKIRGQEQGKLRVRIALENGNSRSLKFSDIEQVEFPHSTELMGGYSSRAREVLSVIVDREKHGKVRRLEISLQD